MRILDVRSLPFTYNAKYEFSSQYFILLLRQQYYIIPSATYSYVPVHVLLFVFAFVRCMRVWCVRVCVLMCEAIRALMSATSPCITHISCLYCAMKFRPRVFGARHRRLSSFRRWPSNETHVRAPTIPHRTNHHIRRHTFRKHSCSACDCAPRTQTILVNINKHCRVGVQTVCAICEVFVRERPCFGQKN